MTVHCIQIYFNLLWNVYLTLTFDNVTYSKLNLIFVCIAR